MVVYLDEGRRIRNIIIGTAEWREAFGEPFDLFVTGHAKLLQICSRKFRLAETSLIRHYPMSLLHLWSHGFHI